MSLAKERVMSEKVVARSPAGNFARLAQLLDLITTNAANSCTGFGSRANRKVIFDWSQEAEQLTYALRTDPSIAKATGATP